MDTAFTTLDLDPNDQDSDEHLTEWSGLVQMPNLTMYITPTEIAFPADPIVNFITFYSFVDAVITHKGSAFFINPQTRQRQEKTPELAVFFRCFEQINAYMPTREAGVLYCDELKFAFDTYQKMKIQRECWRKFNLTSSQEVKDFDDQQVKAFESIIQAIRRTFRQQPYLTWKSKQTYEQQRLIANYQHYIDQLFRSKTSVSQCRRLLVVRLDLGLSTVLLLKYELEFFLSCINRLFLHYKHQSVFEHLVGYIRKVECGIDKGWHAHLILFFNLNRVRSAFHHAQQVGRYWQTLVSQQKRLSEGYSSQGHKEPVSGIFHNCHASTKKYKYLGVGELDPHKKLDFEHKRGNLKQYVLPYLFKDMTKMQIRLLDMPKQKLLVRSQLALSSGRQPRLTPSTYMADQPKPVSYQRSTRKRPSKPQLPQSTSRHRQHGHSTERPLRMSDVVKKPRAYRPRRQRPQSCYDYYDYLGLDE